MSDKLKKANQSGYNKGYLAGTEAAKHIITELEAVIEGDLESFQMAGELYIANKRIAKLEESLRLSITGQDVEKQYSKSLEVTDTSLREDVSALEKRMMTY